LLATLAFRILQMAQDNRGGGPSRGGNNRGGPGGRGPGGKGGFGKGPTRPARVETYEDVKLLSRGEGFRIDKSVVVEKGSHRPVKTEYRLTRDGLDGIQVFQRLADAQTASTAPLPEPEPEAAPETQIEIAAEAAAEGGAAILPPVEDDSPAAEEPTEH
jgi:hypothetical protein